jgi:hypothetical protein
MNFFKKLSIILYKKSWSQWPTKKSCYIILSNIQIQLCSFLLEWKWVYLFFHFLFILSLVFGPIQSIHWGRGNGLSSTTQKNKLLENGRIWIMNCNRPNLSHSCEQLFCFAKCPFVKWTCTWKWRTIAKSKRVRMNTNKQKWRTKSKGESVSMNETIETSMKEKKNKEVERKKT